MKIPSDLEGSESPDSARAERARYWYDFYERIANFEERILTQMIELSRSMPAEHQGLVEETNIEPLRALIEDFKRRRDLWSQGAPVKEEDSGL